MELATEHLERYRAIIPEWEAFLESLQHPLPTVLWTNTLRITPEELVAILREEGIAVTPLPWYPGAFRVQSEHPSPGTTWAYFAGLFHIQEEVSLLPPYLLQPQPNERILDLCAAPGNKTAQIAVMMENTGTVVANDHNRHRVGAIRAVVDRLGLINVSILVSDGTSFSPRNGTFDRVLVDVPCSCEGTSRKTPTVLAQCSLHFSERLAKRQLLLLKRAVEVCRPGGIIAYSTCTYAPEENEMVVDQVLQLFPEQLEILPITIPNFTFSPGLTAWQGHELNRNLRHTLRVYPHQNDTGGFYVALLRKRQ